ncbi:cAMP-binding domain of CRP or a regulatory subunit of cAMP-dependent protein kinases [Aquiflexum balticum DSM 16537]|uniref:cAMP-binding domain of CRP or a regulatory subunit of cAMP-dependent protein kinases n=1 Tax=Aquiflexum balticum DSM 16537 TaxID=758820 RepID=A0A1W2H7H8_9BACT|nr:Crp/Fnr family transcriptional regulator [Aquiflexum balticum]SMD44819.1 cAMP-binding domain of CRP or a regulatory subunit of cAMP-dependent protein kinases [Aquiflexum balticum DSM 16537]
MNTEKILNQIGEIYLPLNHECQQELIAYSKVNTFKRGEVVVREGQFSKKAYLIVEGCSRAYYLKDGKDITDWFTFENQFMAPIVSFFSDKPSPHYVEFVEDSTVLEFSKDIMDKLTSKHHEFERFISKVVTETMLGLCERLYTIQFNKADERYNHLLSIYPNITNRVPLTHIASYLGITLETLSRIRNPKNRL